MSDMIESHLGYAGISTFMRAPFCRKLDKVDLVVMGNPFDSGTSNRAGARLGPRALRDVSLQISAYGKFYPWDYDVRDRCKLIDYGDVIGDRIGAGGTEAMVEAMTEACRKVYSAGAFPLILGGDHTNPYGPMRAAAEKYGPLAMIHFDSHQDAVKSGDGHIHHGSFAWDLVEEGVIDDEHSAQLYIRTLAPSECQLNYNIFYANEAMAMGPEALAAKVRDIVGSRPIYITFDIDALDPSCAPGTGTPVCGGPNVHDVRRLLWALKGLDVIGADLVEVCPQIDAANQLTAVAGATLCIDLLYLMAEARAELA